MPNTLTKDGKIRKNKTCPFLSRCSMKTANCPQRGNVRKDSNFSCGTARLFALAKPLLTELPIPTPQPELDPIHISVEQKIEERTKPVYWVSF